MKITGKGTPKTLLESILNGLDAYYSDPKVLSRISNALIIETHVKDYLAQKLTIAMSKAQTRETTEILKNLCEDLGFGEKS